MKIILEGDEVTEYLAWKCPKKPVRIVLTVTDSLTGLPLRLENGMFQQPVDRKATISASYVDQFGNICPIGNLPKPVWTVSDPTLASLIVAADGMSATHETATGVLGSDTINVIANGLTGSVSIQFIPGTPVAINLSIGALSPR